MPIDTDSLASVGKPRFRDAQAGSVGDMGEIENRHAHLWMALKHWENECTVATADINNPVVVSKRIIRGQRTVDALGEALHGVIEQPSGFGARRETGLYVSTKDIAERMLTRANGSSPQPMPVSS